MSRRSEVSSYSIGARAWRKTTMLSCPSGRPTLSGLTSIPGDMKHVCYYSLHAVLGGWAQACREDPLVRGCVSCFSSSIAARFPRRTITAPPPLPGMKPCCWYLVKRCERDLSSIFGVCGPRSLNAVLLVPSAAAALAPRGPRVHNPRPGHNRVCGVV